jgi:hypothetical protein
VSGRLAVVAAVACAAGCGGGATHADWANPQTIRLGGDERCGPRDHSIALNLRRLTLERDRWRVDASVVNRTGVPVSIIRPHTDETYFGLAAFPDAQLADVANRVERRQIHLQLVADRFDPALPRRLTAGGRWTGTFSGPGRLPRGRVIRVVTGRFVIVGSAPRGLYREFLCVSEHGRRVR